MREHLFFYLHNAAFNCSIKIKIRMHLFYVATVVILGNFLLVSADTDTTATVTKKAFLDITIGGKPAGRVVLGLFGNTAPKTVDNFASLAGMEVSETHIFFYSYKLVDLIAACSVITKRKRFSCLSISLLRKTKSHEN